MDNQVLAFWQRPILLVGNIGAGKTTFIRHLIKVSAKEILRDAVLLYVDLGAFAWLCSKEAEFIVGQCIEIDGGQAT